MKFLSAFLCALCGFTHAAEPLKLLFAGSSMYWNDLPREVARLVDGKIAGYLGQPVILEAVGRSGSDIRMYLEPGINRYEYGVKPGQGFTPPVGWPDALLLITAAAVTLPPLDSYGGAKSK